MRFGFGSRLTSYADDDAQRLQHALNADNILNIQRRFALQSLAASNSINLP
jgi:hypothetical protein